MGNERGHLHSGLMIARNAVVLTALVAAQSLAQTPPPRGGHVMTTAGPSGGVLLLGGQIIDGTPRIVDTLWQWNGTSWRALANNGPHSRSLPAAAYDSRRNVLVVYGGVG